MEGISYVDPFQQVYLEIEEQHMCIALIYLVKMLGGEVPCYFKSRACHRQGNLRWDLREELEQKLCDLCRGASSAVLYDGRNSGARKAAEWWDEYKATEARKIAEVDFRKLESKLVPQIAETGERIVKLLNMTDQGKTQEDLEYIEYEIRREGRVIEEKRHMLNLARGKIPKTAKRIRNY